MPQRTIRKIIENQQVFALPANTAVVEAARLMTANKLGAAIVIEDDRLVGIFTERDVLSRVVAEGRDPQTTELAAVMTTGPQTIGPDQPFGHALHLMYQGGFRHVPVVEHGRPIGMISARDALGPELEEFVSQLHDQDHITEILG